MIRQTRAAVLALVLGAPFALPAAGEEAVTYQNLLKPLLSAGKTILDQPIAYPQGTAKVTAAIVTIPPGSETGWHTHHVPLFVHILDGEVTVDYGSKGVKVYKAGESLLEAEDWPHNGMNKGTVPVDILAVYMGAEGVANAEPATRQ